MIIAAACHDYGHPGFNNIYLVETFDDIAVKYNDKTVLENYHVASSFLISKKKGLDIFSDLEKDTKKDIRLKMITMILATDMADHFKSMGKLKSKLTQDNCDFSDPEEKLHAMGFLMHMADISNPSKSWDICFKWTELLFCEFFY
jgi:hypothetical protein